MCQSQYMRVYVCGYNTLFVKYHTNSMTATQHLRFKEGGSCTDSGWWVMNKIQI